MKVVYADRARRDIDEIYDAIALHNRDAAQRVEDLIYMRRACRFSLRLGGYG
jgi:plasmid stabilization system protein ParE